MKRAIGSILVVSVFVGGAGCAHVEKSNSKLRAGAEKVRVIEYLRKYERDRMKDIGSIQCRQCDNEGASPGMPLSCMNELRNQAQEVGGRIVLVEEGWRALRSGQLADCVDVKGVVYQ